MPSTDRLQGTLALLLDATRRDIRHAFRSLSSTPAFTAVALAVLTPCARSNADVAVEVRVFVAPLAGQEMCDSVIIPARYRPMDALREQRLVSWTHVIYGLHALSLVSGIIGVATVVGAFLTGWPSIIAVILNYVKRGEVSGTWLESHFRWQIRTFWYGLLWVSLCVLFVIMTLGIGILIAWFPLAIVSVWFIYRIGRGWIALNNRRLMYGLRF